MRSRCETMPTVGVLEAPAELLRVGLQQSDRGHNHGHITIDAGDCRAQRADLRHQTEQGIDLRQQIDGAGARRLLAVLDRNAAAELMANIAGKLVGHNRTNNQPAFYWYPAVDYSPSKGVAAYFPSGAFAVGYNELQWASASQWDEFAAWMNQP